MDLKLTSSQYFTNMNEFRKKQLHCDVTVCVNGHNFPCHRLVLSSASTYFNSMFNSNFDESDAKNITLKEEISATIFEEILNAMYTTQLAVTSETAYHLWKACSFLGMPVFENVCTEYIKMNLPVDNLIDVYILADVLKEETLLDVLASYIAENIVELSKTNAFSRFSFDIFKLILSQKNLAQDDGIISIIGAWLKENANDDVELARKLLESSEIKKVSVAVMAKLITYFDSGKIMECQTNEKTSSDCIKLEIVSKNSRDTMKVYTKVFNESCCSYDMIVLEYNGSKKWAPVRNFNSSFENLKTIVVGNRQYFLAYDRNRNSIFGSQALFWMIEDGKCTRLREPPVITEYYQLAAIKNMIYLYCSFDSIQAASAPKTSDLWCDIKNVNNCVFTYNSDVDIWSSTPPITTLVKGASLVAHSNMLYVIGGLAVSNDNKFTSREGLQRYDYRDSKWYMQPGGSHANRHSGAACVYKKRLYYTGNYNGENFQKFTSVYDFNTERWDALPGMQIARKNHLLVPCNGFLYAIDNKQHSLLEKFNRTTGSWIEEPSLPPKISFRGCTMYTCDVTDAIV